MDANKTDKVLQPREPRATVNLEAQLLSGHDEQRDILIINLSRQGIGARCRTGAPSMGDRVIIHVADLPPLTGSVRWCRGEQFGVRLDDEIDPERIAAAALPPADGPRPGIDFDF